MESMQDFQKTFAEKEPVALLKKHRITTKNDIKAPPYVVQIDNKTEYPLTIFTEGNLSVISGKAKARKSFAVAMFAASTISGEWLYKTFKGVKNKKVLYFDTEQSSFYVQQLFHRIKIMANVKNIDANFYCYALRSLSVEQRVEIIDYVFKQSKNIGLVIIDGIRDLMKDINSAEESTELTTKLMQWSETTGAHILTVLHENPNSEKLRGHIGTELMNKAETVIGIVKGEDNDKHISTIKCRMNRGLDFDDIYFTIKNDIPEVVLDYIPLVSRANELQ